MELMTVVAYAGGIAATFVLGFGLGALLKHRLDVFEVRMWRAEAKHTRREAGKLANRIGAQRRAMRKLREQLRTVSATTTPIATNIRPNLPH